MSTWRRCGLLLALVVLAAPLLAACGPDAAEGPPPEDFALTYDWREGSLPPPYHYEYTITLAADGSGVMTMVPDYPGAGVPVWEEPFTVTADEVARLHDLMVAEGLLRERWRGVDDHPIGGSFASLSVTHGGKTIEVPPFAEQEGQAEAIFAAVEAIVPADLRADLEARRAEYEADQLNS